MQSAVGKMEAATHEMPNTMGGVFQVRIVDLLAGDNRCRVRICDRSFSGRGDWDGKEYVVAQDKLTRLAKAR